jgi:4-hydroxy-L-threonine phosphate dehydrogenase PdxA
MLLSQRRHDVYLAMYHDQGHIPIKLLSPLEASALSVGSGLVFSSVGHGCAYDIAGRGTADPKAALRTVRMLAGLSS